ncbi:MAG: hypothetical protein DLM53_10805 [Candidatus Eremiobacter antarcticus]|nr:hypothetical protein [Candidatus Eremiobacteraeota bacterium]PZR60836.1 MAG: hypothetical protein DLM53_10805 [Candidatus Eremiobacter sp. RRmetagenome_bin22]
MIFAAIAFAAALQPGFISHSMAGAAPAVPQAVQTAPPDRAAPSPTPLPLLLSGQIVDLESGFIVFATGDALKLASGAAITDYGSGAAPAYAISPGIYAVVTLDAASGEIQTVRTSRKPLVVGTPAALVPRRYVVTLSSPKPNPDLAPRQGLHPSILSKAVTVTVTVAVPPNTPFSDDVYMATDTSGWNAQAIKMQRLDGLHFQIRMELRGGSDIRYVFTRGTWSTVERDRAGLQRASRSLFVAGGDAQIIDATVYRWADLQ